jgi:hypothetical protein
MHEEIQAKPISPDHRFNLELAGDQELSDSSRADKVALRRPDNFDLKIKLIIKLIQI